jgi:transcriptional regulator with XRE-family HTH domain
MSKSTSQIKLDAESVAAAFRARSPEHERLYRESEARATLSAQLKLIRVRAGVSQAALAERIGRKQPFIARLENGGYDRCGFSTLRTIVRALGFDFAFERMFKATSAASYSGKSSCDYLELAFEEDQKFADRIAQYAFARWTATEGTATSEIVARPPKASHRLKVRGLSTAA